MSEPPPTFDRSPLARRRLDGLIVATLSRILAGPDCTNLLAYLGATVVNDSARP